MSKLYKPSKKGDKVQHWEIQVEGDKYRTIEGYLGMTLTESAWTTCFPKNVGKVNSTTAEQQAVLEAESKAQRKRDKGYTDNIEEISRPFVPTLAKKWEDYKDVVEYPVFVAAKLDGQRCYIKNGQMFSRANKLITSCNHILDGLETDYILDGELYNHDLRKDFNKIVSLTRTLEAKDECKDLIQFHCFDIVADNSFSFRYDEITDLEERNPNIRAVEQICAWNEKEVDELAAKFVAEGYEGAMVRWGTDGYILERTNKLLKYKTFRDEEFEIIRLEDGRGKRQNTCAKWVLKTKDDQEFEASTTGTDEENRNNWMNKDSFVGKMATIKFQDLTPAGVPRFGTFKAIKED